MFLPFDPKFNEYYPSFVGSSFYLILVFPFWFLVSFIFFPFEHSFPALVEHSFFFLRFECSFTFLILTQVSLSFTW